MSDRSPACGKPAAPVTEPADGPSFEPYESPAGGWGALQATARALREQSIAIKGSKALLSMNQPHGFDCPGCAWPDPKHTSSFEFCENGAKAVSFELTERKVTREFFAAHTVSELAEHSDYWLEEQGRLLEPMRYDSATDHYVPISWERGLRHDRRSSQRAGQPRQGGFLHLGPRLQRGRLPLSALRPPFRDEQFPRLLEHVPRGDQRRPAGEHRHRQGNGPAGGFRCHGRDLRHRPEPRHQQPPDDDLAAQRVAPRRSDRGDQSAARTRAGAIRRTAEPGRDGDLQLDPHRQRILPGQGRRRCRRAEGHHEAGARGP